LNQNKGIHYLMKEDPVQHYSLTKNILI